MAGAPKSRGMFQYVFKHFWDSFKVGKVSPSCKYSIWNQLQPEMYLSH